MKQTTDIFKRYCDLYEYRQKDIRYNPRCKRETNGYNVAVDNEIAFWENYITALGYDLVYIRRIKS